ncbi:MAG: hypothetical protein ACXVRX_09115, partial [Solirubrobacteraceae bacterium]
MRQRVGTDETAPPAAGPGTASPRPALGPEPDAVPALTSLGSAIGNRALGRIVRDPVRVRGRGLTPGGALRARVVARQPTTTTTTT